jgi:sn-glycerol 3-phosphate transport system ATP-binding protein
MTLADRLVVLNQGRIEQIGAPAEVYRRPASRFVASFIGAPAMNFIEGRVVADGLVEIAAGRRLAVLHDTAAIGSGVPLTLGVRPEEIEIVDAPHPGGLDFEVELVEELGTGQVLHGRSGEIEMTVVRNGGGEHGIPRAGARLYLKIPVAALHLFDAASGRRIDLPPSRLAAE